MTDHLPECDLSMDCGLFHGQSYCHNCEMYCVCDRLRACEQRVLNLNHVAHDVLIAQRARERALDAAREAVAFMPGPSMSYGNREYIEREAALKAIKGLREPQ